MPRPEGLDIRPLSFEDARQFWELRRLPGVMWGTMGMPSRTLEATRKRLEANLTDPDSHLFAAELDGKLVGTASFHIGSGKMRHVGHVGSTSTTTTSIEA